MKDDETSNQTREKILKAALQLFSRKGYRGATTREIALAAGVAEVTLFRHFHSKQQLLETLMARKTFLPKLKELLPELSGLPYEEALTIIANQFLATLEGLTDWIRFLQSEVNRSPAMLHKVFHEFLDELFETFASYFREMQQKGELRDFDSELGARMFHGMFYNYFNVEELLTRKRHKASERARVVEEFVTIFVRGTLKK